MRRVHDIRRGVGAVGSEGISGGLWLTCVCVCVGFAFSIPFLIAGEYIYLIGLCFGCIGCWQVGGVCANVLCSLANEEESVDDDLEARGGEAEVTDVVAMGMCRGDGDVQWHYKRDTCASDIFSRYSVLLRLSEVEKKP